MRIFFLTIMCMCSSLHSQEYTEGASIQSEILYKVSTHCYNKRERLKQELIQYQNCTKDNKYWELVGKIEELDIVLYIVFGE